MNIPNWWTTILLALAAFRSWRLIAEDDILDRPRRYVTRLGTKWQKEGDSLPKDYRLGLAEFISCPWCLGAYTAAAWWGAWTAWEHGTLVAAGLVSIATLVPMLEHLLSE